MAIIATLGVSVVARTKRFRSGLGKASKILKSFAKSVGRVSLSVVKFGTALATGAVVGLGIFINRSLKAIDEAGKLSDILNISTEDLLAFRLQAELAGGSVAGFDKLLGIFVKRLGESKEGTGEAARTIELLGLNIDDLINLDTADALGVVTDAINQLGTAAEINSARNRIFGKQGIIAGNQLAQGSEGFRKARIEAERLGITVSRFDAAKIEEANDSFTRLNFLIKGFSRQLTVQLSPFITAANDKLVDMGTSGEGMGKKIVDGLEKVIIAIVETIDFAKSLGGVFQRVGGFGALALAGIRIAAVGFDEGAAKLIRTGIDLRNSADETFRNIVKGKTLKDIKKRFDDIRTSADRSAKSIVENSKGIKGLGKGLPGIKTSTTPTITTFARQIELSKVAITGLGGSKRRQQVNDPQLQTTNRILGNILNNLGGNVAVTV